VTGATGTAGTTSPEGPAGRLKTVVCISALNEERTIQSVLQQAALSGAVDEIVVVVNGSTDRTARAAREALPSGRPEVLVKTLPERLGHDVGRSLAAAEALARGAEIFLFLDGDFAVAAPDIVPFRRAVESGVDVALNRLTPLWPDVWPQGPVAWARRALNVFLGRPELGLDGLTAVPHALSRRAVETVGPAALAVPPLAHALAVMAGLEVKSVHTVAVAVPNRPAADRPRALPPAAVAELILGDHLEAIAALIARRGPRGGFGDGGRRRDLLPEGAGWTFSPGTAGRPDPTIPAAG